MRGSQRWLRIGVAGLTASAAAAAAAAALGASDARPTTCDACGGGFSTLSSDIVSLVPASQQPSLLTRVTFAHSLLFPAGPVFPPSPCASAAVLDSVGFSTLGLAHAGLISSQGSATLLGDVTTLNNGIITTFPPSPCFSTIAFRSTGD
jgi:hypothetical protein